MFSNRIGAFSHVKKIIKAQRMLKIIHFPKFFIQDQVYVINYHHYSHDLEFNVPNVQ